MNKSATNEDPLELQTLLAIRELLHWTKVSSYKNVKSILESALDSESKKIIYLLSDGKNSYNEIVDKGHVAPNSISKYWNEWGKLGIGELIPINGKKRFKAIFDLNNFGLLPESMQAKEKNNAQERNP